MSSVKHRFMLVASVEHHNKSTCYVHRQCYTVPSILQAQHNRVTDLLRPIYCGNVGRGDGDNEEASHHEVSNNEGHRRIFDGSILVFSLALVQWGFRYDP